MKMKITRLLQICFASSLLLVGCGNSKTDPVDPVTPVVKDKFIIQNSRSEYSIIIPKNAKANESAAAKELSTYLNYSTGARLRVIKDNEYVKGSKYISLGTTTLLRNNFSNEDFSFLDDKISSYFVSTKDDNIYVYSNPNERGEGTLYGTYDLLHDLVGYEFYAEDEIYYEKKAEVNLLNYENVFVEPSFDGRAIGNYYLTYHQNSCTHLRLHNIYRGTEWASGLYGHGQVTTFVRPQDIISGGQTIHDVHPDWFSNKVATHADTTNNQLCWTAGHELEEYVANRFIHFFQQYPDATYFMFGQEDNNDSFCHCERCEAAMAGDAINYAGLQIMFMNNVIKMTDAWLAENQPGRTVRYVVYAYYATKDAPCVEKDGMWVAANDKVIPNKNLYLFLAPIGCNFAYPLENSYFNSDTYLALKQWSQVAPGKVIIYFYDVNFRYYFANYYNFGTVKAMYQTCKDLGVSYAYTQGAMDTVTGCFNDMREYVESKLMWDLDKSYNDLAKDFIKHYYYEAADEMLEYYETVRDRLVEYHANRGDGGSIYTNILNTTLYPYPVLRYYTSLFNKAMEKIAHYQQENPSFYEILKGRLMKEYLSVIYLKITLAKSDISEQEKAEMKEIFSFYTSLFGISKTQENGTSIDVDLLFA